MAITAQQVGRISAARLLAAVVCALATVVTVGTVAIVGAGWEGEAVGYSTERELAAVLLVVAALVLLAAGVVPLFLLGDERKPATWLAVAVIASQLPLWSGWTELDASVRAAVVAATFTVPGAVAAALSRPRAIGFAALGLGGVAGLLHVTVFDPFREIDCHELRTCVAADPILGSTAAVPVMAAGTGLGLLAVILGLAGAVTAPAPTAARVAAGVAVAAAAAVVTGPWQVDIAGDTVPGDDLLALAVAAFGLVLGAQQVRIRHTRRAVDRLILELEGAAKTAGSADEELAADTVPQSAGLPGRSVLTAAQRLALENAQLMARSRASLMRTRALQRQAQQRADDERERIEQDLHDGAQQQLVTAAIHLGLASSTASSTGVPAYTGALASVRAATFTALEALREIAHGPFPRSLEGEGLIAALEDLCADHGRQLETGSTCPPALDVQVARAAYTVVAASLADSADDAGNAIIGVVRVRCRSDELIVTVGSPFASLPLDVVDRLHSVGGRIATGPAITEVVLPCVW